MGRPPVAHYRRLHLPQDPAAFLEPLIQRAKAGVLTVSKTTAECILRVDHELHLAPLEPMADDPKVTKLRAALDRRAGEAQLPELILAVDAQVRFSCWDESRDRAKELLSRHAGQTATTLTPALEARILEWSVSVSPVTDGRTGARTKSLHSWTSLT